MKRAVWSTAQRRTLVLLGLLGGAAGIALGLSQASASPSSARWRAPSPASPSIGTRLSATTVGVGTGVRESAWLASRDGERRRGTLRFRHVPAAGGTVTYTVYPSLAACRDRSGGTSEGIVIVRGGTVPDSSAFTPTSPGRWYWQAVYSGDRRTGGASSDCSRGKLTVSRASPRLATRASGPVAVGHAIGDTATLAGAYGNPSSDTIVFALYAVGHVERATDRRAGRDRGGRGGHEPCGTPVATVGATRVAHGTYASAPFTPAHAGSYRWVASFAGDAGNAAVAGRCGAPGETSVVRKATPAISTSPSAGVAVGGTVWDHASLAGGYRPTGTVTFVLYRDRRCTRRVSASTTALGPGGATSRRYAPTAPGVYYWRARYSGDRDNEPVASPCGAGHETVIVRGAGAAYAIGGDVAIPLYPGAPARPIDVTFRNPYPGHGRGIEVSHLTVAIASITGGSNTPYPCTAADFVLTQYAGPYPFSVPHGTSSLSTILPSLPSGEYPSIRMIDRRDAVPGDGTGNQDGCEGATVHLAYTGTP